MGRTGGVVFASSSSRGLDLLLAPSLIVSRVSMTVVPRLNPLLLPNGMAFPG